MKKLTYLFLALIIVACSSDDDNTAPVVTLIGESSITVTQNATYEDAGATATDNVDGDLTSNISTTSNVDTSTLGTYTVTHSVSDASGNNGSASRQVVVMVQNLVIGQSYQGGIIAYIFQSGDTGYVAGEQHGLICATVDQSPGIQWYYGTYIDTGATGTAIGTGLTNTNTIIAAQGSGSYAASIARDYNGGGYTDWYLPCGQSLSQMYYHRDVVNPALIANGGTVYSTSDWYWSSTENTISTAAQVDLSNGNYTGNTPKSEGNVVRAVRAF